jgi:endoglucanase
MARERENMKKTPFVPSVFLLWIISLFVHFYSTGSAYAAAGEMRTMTSMQMVYDMKVGWNLGNTLDAWNEGVTGLKTEVCWNNPYTTKQMIDAVKAKGFKTVRIPVTWNNHFGGAPDYTIDKEWMDRVEEIVNWVLDNDMYAILNTHHDEWVILKASSQNEVTDKITKIWAQIAERFKNYSDYLIFETLNEPRLYGEPEEWNGGTRDARTILNTYNLAIVNTIRSSGGNNALRHLLIPTHAATAMEVAVNDLVIPNDDGRIMVSLHTYWPYNFTMNTGNGATDQWGSNSDKNACDQELDRIYDKFCARGIPVIIGEWGSIDKSNTSVRALHAGYYAREVRERGMLPVWWDNGWAGAEGFALLDRNTVTWCFSSIVDSLIQGVEKGSETGVLRSLHKSDGFIRVVYGSVNYSLPVASDVSLRMFTIQGQNIFSIFHRSQTAGNHSITLPIHHISSGNYILRMNCNGRCQAERINVVK